MRAEKTVVSPKLIKKLIYHFISSLEKVQVQVDLRLLYCAATYYIYLILLALKMHLSSIGYE